MVWLYGETVDMWFCFRERGEVFVRVETDHVGGRFSFDSFFCYRKAFLYYLIAVLSAHVFSFHAHLLVTPRVNNELF